jgi:putative phosphoesterase
VTRLLLISDTHLPKRAKVLPAEVWAEVERADAVLHAGDWVTASLLDEVQERADLVIGVYGNNDGDDLRARLPEIARFEFDGIRFAMIHETGAATKREERMDAKFPDADIVVFGHSHIPWDSVTPGGRRLLNPGSPTDRRRQPACTYMIVDTGGEGIAARVHALPSR